MTITSTDTQRRETVSNAMLSSYITSVALEGALFADAVENGPLDVAVADCPGWDLRDLVLHLGEIHLWAAANVAFPKPQWLEVGQLTDLASCWPHLAGRRPSDHELVTWYRATHENLLDVLRSAPLDVDAFTFLPSPTPLTMWARRQASEIAVHRFDAEYARGRSSHFSPAFAGDMLDELLTGFARLYTDVRTDDACVLRVAPTDVDGEWWVTMAPSGMSTSRSGQHADLTLAGSAADLYLTLWNRRPTSDLGFNGDPRVLKVWRNSCRVVWTG